MSAEDQAVDDALQRLGTTPIGPEDHELALSTVRNGVSKLRRERAKLAGWGGVDLSELAEMDL